MAIYIRLTLVIARKEELLEELHPTRETNERAAWYDVRERRIVISDSDGTRVVGVDPNCDRRTTEMRRISYSSSSKFGSQRAARKQRRW